MSSQAPAGPMRPCSAIGMIPMRGLRISTQPIARSSGGVTIGIRIAAANRFRPGQVGALNEQTERQRNGDRHGGAAEREDDRVAHQHIGVRIAPDLDVVIERPAGAERQPQRTEAADDDSRKRHEREEDKQNSKAREGRGSRR